MDHYTLGLDIGITSVGACAIDQQKGELIEMSVRRFDEAKEAKEARSNRSARRTARRKKWRKDQLLAAFDDFGIVSREERKKYGDGEYLNFNSTYNGLLKPQVYTVYHLRQKALNEPVSNRELLLCLYNIMQARGHFLLDAIDFSKDGINFELFKEKFYELSEPFIEYAADRSKFEDMLLKKIFTSAKLSSKDLSALIDKERFTENEESDKGLTAICLLLTGRKGQIGRFYNQEDEKTTNIETLKKSDELNEFQAALVELHDLCRIARILKDGNQYVCDIAVSEIDKYRKYKEGKGSEEDYKAWQSVSKGKKHVRAYKNLNNSYPNGLYVKEVNAILHNQQKYHPEISDPFIEVCCSIASARIPYYVGPLGKDAKNAWAEKNGKLKYSYDYSIRHFDAVNVEETIRNWKKNMISHCTYFTEETALPKGSLIGEVFSIVNELNNFNCIDRDDNDYYLSREDKIKVIDELFMKKDTVTLEDVRKTLDLKEYYSEKGKTAKFNNKISLYRKIASISNDLKLNSVMEIFGNREKIEQIESIILDLNLFDEGKLKNDYFVSAGFTEDQAKKLSAIKSNGFYSFSKKFIFEQPMDEEGNSLLDLLFEDNSPSFRNNQQVRISRAVDKDGNKIDFLSEKYERIIRKNNNQLNIGLLLDEGKPLIPISRPTIRALNETFKVYEGYLKIYGVPERVVVETARGRDAIKDFTEQNGSPMRHYDKTSRLLNYLNEQIKEKDKSKILSRSIEAWDELESYYNSHKLEIELYIRQDGMDLLTGKKIDIHHLEDYEVDHILPRGFGDDSQDDKMLIAKTINGMKGDRLPIEFLESRDAINCGALTVGSFVKIVNKLAELKMISDKKQERLLLKNQKEAEGFINQNLVDTRYVISQFVSMLNAYNKVNGYDTHVVCMRSSYTDLYRRVLGFNKDRDVGDQHHAIDAACICIADKCLSTYYPHYDQRKDARSRNAGKAGFEAYSEFVKELNEMRTNNDSYNKLRRFVVFAFKKAYGQDVYKLGKDAPLIEQIKSRTPLLSWKVEKNYNGKLFDATLYKPKGADDKSVLSLLNVNNDKRSFDSVYPVAVDFYKIKHKHYAIHIPLAIVGEDGTINKKKYIKLIKDHYKAEDLLVDGEINEKAFRFRAFKRDMIYETRSNECYLFNLGSIAIKKMEITPLNIYSYSSIYDFSDEIRIGLISRFNIRTRKNPDGVDFTTLDKEMLVDYMCEQFGILNNPEKHRNRLNDLTKDINNIYKYCDKVSYLCSIANQLYMPPLFDKQILPVADNMIINKDPDAEYIKLKYNILGVRFKNSDKGTLIVEGPKGYKNGGFKRIKKEEFHWNISRNMLK